MNGPTVQQALIGLLVFFLFFFIGRAVAAWIGWI